MSERVKLENQQAKEKREVFSVATEQCEEQLESAVKSLSQNIRNKIVANGEVISNENRNVIQMNKEVNSIVEGFQEKISTCDSKFDTFVDTASSLDYFDKWVRNIKGKMYDVSHIMEEICLIEQDELRPVE